MTTKLVALVLLAALLMLAAVPAEAADVKELFAIDLADYPGKEGRMIEVSYPPGAQDMVHRHDAHAFVYVLEGHSAESDRVEYFLKRHPFADEPHHAPYRQRRDGE